MAEITATPGTTSGPIPLSQVLSPSEISDLAAKALVVDEAAKTLVVQDARYTRSWIDSDFSRSAGLKLTFCINLHRPSARGKERVYQRQTFRNLLSRRT